MKLKSLIMFSAAALAFAACSNDEEVNGGIKGDATVTVNVQDAITRAIKAPTIGDNGDRFDVDVQTLSLTLVADAGGNTITQYNAGGTYTFPNVRNPRSITVVINDGVAEGTMVMSEDIVNSDLAEPLYASTTQFTQNGSNYTVTLQPKHRLARLEFSGIQHVDDGDCSYTSLTFDGLYLNGVRKSEANNETLTANTPGSAWNEAIAWNLPYYDWAGDETGVVVVGTGADNTPLPTGDQCYAYNFIPGESLPILTLCFSNAEQPTVEVVNDTKTRYASVKTYKIKLAEGESVADLGLEGIEADGTISKFVAGYIYHITDLKYADEDLGYDPTGKNGTLTATVVVDEWTLVNGTVEWNK